MRKTLLLADDHSLMLEGLTRLLAEEYEIAGTATNGRELLNQAQRLRPNVIVLDVGMPEMNGIEAARQILSVLPQTKLVFVTQQLDQNYLHAAFQAGANGYVAKQSASSELLAAIRMALQGRFYVTPLIPITDQGLLRDPRKNPAGLFGGQLTQRQREVLQLVAEGKAMKEISTALNISVKTVEFHKNGLMNELGLRTTAELVRYAIDQGMVTAKL
jgi:DNA-binding NarL/FixJ family response regulator